MMKRRLLTIALKGLLTALIVLVVVFHHPLKHIVLHPSDLLGALLDSGPPAQNGGRVSHQELAGVPNFGQVTERLYRGGQPSEEGFRALKALGVEIVISLRHGEKQIATERASVEALGLRYVSIPWSTRDEPSNMQVAELLELLHDNPDKRIFVHCSAARDRTGVMIAAFRIARQEWTPTQALNEMKHFGFRDDLQHFWHYHLKTYVGDLPQQLATDPNLRRWRASVHVIERQHP